ncbi:hypothetical protein [Roseinatronobacter sp.]
MGGVDVIRLRNQPGLAPPGVGRINNASPPQTNDMPSVTTIAGSSSLWITAPITA